MGTYTGTAGTRGVNSTTPISTTIRIPSGSTPTSITLGGFGSHPNAFWFSNQTSVSYYIYILVGSVQSSRLATINIDRGGYAWSASSNGRTGNHTYTLSGMGSAGGQLRIQIMKGTAYDPAELQLRNQCTISVTTSDTTACGAPGSVSLSRSRGTVTITWTAGSAGTNNAISNYGVIRNTSASTSGATTISTGASSGITNAPGAGTFYYGVRTQGAAGSSYYSGYKWSGAITVPSKPSVSAGTVATDTQMDTLRTWINGSGITDIADATQIKASQGNTYRSGLTAGSSKIEASWYNAAANG